jgi:hypothetical protein
MRLKLGESRFKVNLGKKVWETLSHEKNLGVVEHACHPRDCGKHKIGRSQFRLA